MGPTPILTVDRYALFAPIASGGMASVHLACIRGPAGFSRVVAIKRLHPHLSEDVEFRTMLLDEARLASRIAHPNVVPVLDVVAEGHELFIVMEYVRGVSLAELATEARKRKEPVPVPIACAIVIGVLSGLHAAHVATGADGAPLDTVHRDVSPQNVLVGGDGRARLTDFGVAKATSQLQSTREGQLKGKLAYMAPEQFSRGPVDRRTDLYATGIVLWELLAGRRLFSGDPAGIVAAVLAGDVPLLSTLREDVGVRLERVIARAVDPQPGRRFESADAMVAAVADAARPASVDEVAGWVTSMLPARLAELEARAREAESFEEVPSSRDPTSAPGTGNLASAPTGKFDWDVGAVAPATDATATEPMPVEAPPRRGRTVIVAAMAGLFAVAAAGAASSKLLAVAAAPETLRSPQPDQANVAADANLVEQALADASVAASSSAPIAAALPNAASEAVARAPASAEKGRPGTRPQPRPKSRAKPGCDPPFTVDEKGIKVFKRECM